MTPDVLPNPPRKASWKRWIVVLAGVVAVITIALLAFAPILQRSLNNNPGT